ncbi:MAG TPA: T9SS type A sorting domain-containing protein [Rhodothermales bacterium]
MRLPLFAAALLILAPSARAQDQLTGIFVPKIAVAADGSYALAAEALFRPEGGGSEELMVIVQRYAPNGALVGPMWRFDGESCSTIDIWLDDFMHRPEIEFQPNGTLVVLMQHSGEFQIGVDGLQSSEITLAAVAPDGSVVDLDGRESCVQQKLFFLNGGEQDRPRFDVSPTGDFFITADGFFNDSDFRNVAIKILDAAGNEVVDQVIPHDDPGSDQLYHMQPDIATNGQLVVSVWHECTFDDIPCDIAAQFATVTAQGLQVLGGNVTVNVGGPATLHLYPAVDMNAAGASVIAWADARDGLHGEIYAQRFDAAGSPIGANIKVSAGEGELDARPEVALLDNGRFMVVWTDSSSGRYFARGRTFDAAGNPEGGTFLLAPNAVHSGQPAVVADGNGFAYIYISAGADEEYQIGSNKISSLTAAEDPALPDAERLAITALYPNPFVGTAHVAWRAAESGTAVVRVFDLLGREVRRLVDHVTLPGTRTFTIDGNDLAPGVYFLEIRQGDERSVRKLVRAAE